LVIFLVEASVLLAYDAAICYLETRRILFSDVSR
jgi:hypothetical protein